MRERERQREREREREGEMGGGEKKVMQADKDTR